MTETADVRRHRVHARLAVARCGGCPVRLTRRADVLHLGVPLDSAEPETRGDA